MKRPPFYLYAAVGCALAAGLAAQTQTTYYSGVNATGELVLKRTVNLKQLAGGQQAGVTASFSSKAAEFRTATATPVDLAAGKTDIPKYIPLRKAPSLLSAFMMSDLSAAPTAQSLTVVAGAAAAGFDGLTHRDQKLSNSGNQFSVEPPNTSIAAGNGYILQGVNNAVQVYDYSGKPLLAKVLASNQVFGVTPAIDYSTGVNGVFPTDMRVFYDAGINRWFVMQRSQDNDVFGTNLSTSKYYLAVSQTGDPTGSYNIYVMDTTNKSLAGCPCVADYPQIGADQYGIYISANQYQSLFDTYVGASLLAISKAGLGAGATQPAAYKFDMRFTAGDEFTVQPAVTPPGSSYFLANGGVEYFVSANKSVGTSVSLWALSNTSSLITTPSLSLAKISVPTLTYSLPPVATQKEGYRPYGSSLTPPGTLPFIETGDTRALSVMYSTGRLYVSVATAVTDASNQRVAGAAYIVLSPTIRKSALAGSVVQQGYVMVARNHLLFPTMAVDSQGRGVIAATLSGPDWYPSAVFIPFTTFSEPSIVRLVGPGVLPEDGFTGYSGQPARWGDYSSSVISTDGSFWFASEYIGNLPRTQLANWQTFLAQFKP